MKQNMVMKSLIAGMIVSGTALTMSLSAQDANAPVPAPAAPSAVKEELKVDPAATLPDVLAKVGSKDITKKEVLAQLEEGLKFQNRPISAMQPEEFKEMVYVVASNMAKRDFFVDEAAKDGFKADKAAVIKLFMDEIEKAKKENPQMYEGFAAQLKMTQNMTPEQYIEKEASDPDMQKNVAVGQWLEKKVQVTDQEVEKYYADNKDTQFTVPADPKDSARVSHILIIVDKEKEGSEADAQKRANDIIAKLQKGAVFEELVATESACPSKERQGKLGVITKERSFFGPEFVAAALTLETGKVYTKPVKSEVGYHIIRRDASVDKPEVRPLDDNLKAELKRYLSEPKVREFVEKSFDDAVAAGKVKMFIEKPKEAPQAVPQAAK